MGSVVRDLVLAASVLVLAACASAGPPAFVAATPETITSTTEQRTDNPPTHLIYVENHSSVPVTVFSVSLRNCENVRFSCDPRAVNYRVGPGQKVMVLRVEPQNSSRAFGYSFGFSWHADSSSAAALRALAGAGDSRAQVQLAQQARADSIRRSDIGPRYNELSREDFGALAGRVATLRALPESLAIVPGTQASIEHVRLLLLDSQGRVLGQTRWVHWRVPSQRAIRFSPPDQLFAQAPGRMVLTFSLADEAQALLRAPLPDVEVPVVAAYPSDPHAPRLVGQTLDADTQRPMACAMLALEDSAGNTVARDRSGAEGNFMLQAPRPGTYRVRVETRGWAPAYGPMELANADEEKQERLLVRFTEQELGFGIPENDFQHAQPAAVRTQVYGASTRSHGGRAASTPIIQGVTLGGSPSMPILGIVTDRVATGTTWIQFVVDSAGSVDSASVQLPVGATANARTAVLNVLPRVRFTPARQSGAAVCELLRMQVNFSGG